MEPDIHIRRLIPITTGYKEFPYVICTELPPFNLKAFDIPRLQLMHFIKEYEQEFMGKSVVYILYSQELEEDWRRRTYIGESSAVTARFERHLKEKDYWQNALILTSDFFDETCIKFLENELTKIAVHDRSLKVETQRTQDSGQLHPQNREYYEYFLDIIKRYLLFAGGYWGRIPAQTEKIDDKRDESDAQVFYLNYSEFDEPQKMYVIGNVYRIKKGTKISKSENESLITHPYGKKNEELKREGVISREQGLFLKDYDFGSPSLPACIIKGQSASGQRDWKTKDGTAFKDC